MVQNFKWLLKKEENVLTGICYNHQTKEIKKRIREIICRKSYNRHKW